MTTNADGNLIHSVLQTHTGDQIRVMMSDGTVSAVVTSIKEKENGTEEAKL